MSHTTSIKSIKISSVSALRASVTELKGMGIRCALKENAKPRAYYQQQEGMGVADFVLELHDSKYDVGFYKQPDNTYEPRTDFFNSQVERVLGVKASDVAFTEQAKMGKFFQAYGVAAAMETARKQGHMVRKMTREDGTISLEITGATL